MIRTLDFEVPNFAAYRLRTTGCSSFATTVPPDRFQFLQVSLRRRDSNSRYSAYEAGALPLGYPALVKLMTAGLLGIEPRLAGLEAADFPLVDRPVVQEGIEPIQILRGLSRT